MKKEILKFYFLALNFFSYVNRKFYIVFIKLFYLFFNRFYKNKFKAQGIIIIVGSNSSNDINLISKRVKYYFKKYDFELITKKSFFLVFTNKIKLFYNFDELPFYFDEHFNFFSIDPLKNPNDAWVYHNCLNLINPCSEKVLYISRFTNIINKLKKEKAYIFGTGNSLNNIRDFNFKDGYVIVCNTIVKNKQTWDYLNPDALVAADALYHFSDSTFATNFRRDLLNRFQENDNFIFIYPIIFHNFLVEIYKDYEQRLVPIEMGDHKDFKDLFSSSFKFPSLGNVINLLIPIGMSLAKNIFLIGFDGRAPDDNDFWKNSDLHFYQENVYELKSLHPAFFNYYIPPGQENKYQAINHGDQLENNFIKAEKLDWKFISLSNSYTLSIQKRYVREN